MDDIQGAACFARLASEFARLHHGSGNDGQATVIDFSDGDVTVTARGATYDPALLQVDVTMGPLDLDLMPDLATALLKMHHLNAEGGPRSGWFLTIDEDGVMSLQKYRALSAMTAEILTSDMTEALENADVLKAFWLDLVEGQQRFDSSRELGDHVIRA